jgi:hypothetical protein
MTVAALLRLRPAAPLSKSASEPVEALWRRLAAAGIGVIPANDAPAAPSDVDPVAEWEAVAAAAVEAVRRGRAAGLAVRPTLPGPVSWLSAQGAEALAALPAFLPTVTAALAALRAAGAEWVRLDEPALTTQLDTLHRAAFWTAYDVIAAADAPRVMVAGGRGGMGAALDLALKLPVAGLHLDFVIAPQQIGPALAGLRAGAILSLGVADAALDGAQAEALVARAVAALGAGRVEVAPASVDAGAEADAYDVALARLAALTRRAEAA